MDIFVYVRSLKTHHFILLWLLPSLKADVIDYNSPRINNGPNYTQHNLHADGIRIATSTSITFQLKSDGFSYILLQKNQTDYKYNVVEIVLGSSNNEGATISDKQHPLTLYHERGIVSSSEYRYFWISWANSAVRVGKGVTTSQQEFMNWTHLNFDLNYISIGTSSWMDAFWRFTIVSRPTLSKAPSTQSSTIVNVLSTTADSRNSKNEKQESSLVAVYISVTCVVAIIIITGVIIFFFLRRRKRNIRRHESAVYSGNESNNERKPVETVDKMGYDNHSLEKERHLSYSKDNTEFKSLDSHYIDISLSEEPLTDPKEYNYTTVNKKAKDIVSGGHGPEHDEFNYTQVNPKAKGLVEDNYGYNHLNTNQQQENNPQNYSTMAMGTNGLKPDCTDTMYSHIGNRGTKGHKANVEAENTYNKLNVRRNQNEMFGENDKTVYNHAETDVRYPDINDTDDYSHLD